MTIYYIMKFPQLSSNTYICLNILVSVVRKHKFYNDMLCVGEKKSVIDLIYNQIYYELECEPFPYVITNVRKSKSALHKFISKLVCLNKFYYAILWIIYQVYL